MEGVLEEGFLEEGGLLGLEMISCEFNKEELGRMFYMEGGEWFVVWEGPQETSPGA